MNDLAGDFVSASSKRWPAYLNVLICESKELPFRRLECPSLPKSQGWGRPHLFRLDFGVRVDLPSSHSKNGGSDDLRSLKD
jgi:hypothetical protein